MDRELVARCGAYCGDCEWKEKMNCLGYQMTKGNMFWGECRVAKCSIEKGIEHCGFCWHGHNNRAYFSFVLQQN